MLSQVLRALTRRRSKPVEDDPYERAHGEDCFLAPEIRAALNPDIDSFVFENCTLVSVPEQPSIIVCGAPVHGADLAEGAQRDRV